MSLYARKCDEVSPFISTKVKCRSDEYRGVLEEVESLRKSNKTKLEAIRKRQGKTVVSALRTYIECEIQETSARRGKESQTKAREPWKLVTEPVFSDVSTLLAKWKYEGEPLEKEPCLRVSLCPLSSFSDMIIIVDCYMYYFNHDDMKDQVSVLKKTRSNLRKIQGALSELEILSKGKRNMNNTHFNYMDIHKGMELIQTGFDKISRAFPDASLSMKATKLETHKSDEIVQIHEDHDMKEKLNPHDLVRKKEKICVNNVRKLLMNMLDDEELSPIDSDSSKNSDVDTLKNQYSFNEDSGSIEMDDIMKARMIDDRDQYSLYSTSTDKFRIEDVRDTSTPEAMGYSSNMNNNSAGKGYADTFQKSVMKKATLKSGQSEITHFHSTLEEKRTTEHYENEKSITSCCEKDTVEELRCNDEIDTLAEDREEDSCRKDTDSMRQIEEKRTTEQCEKDTVEELRCNDEIDTLAEEREEDSCRKDTDSMRQIEEKRTTEQCEKDTVEELRCNDEIDTLTEERKEDSCQKDTDSMRQNEEKRTTEQCENEDTVEGLRCNDKIVTLTEKRKEDSCQKDTDSMRQNEEKRTTEQCENEDTVEELRCNDKIDTLAEEREEDSCQKDTDSMRQLEEKRTTEHCENEKSITSCCEKDTVEELRCNDEIDTLVDESEEDSCQKKTAFLQQLDDEIQHSQRLATGNILEDLNERECKNEHCSITSNDPEELEVENTTRNISLSEIQTTSLLPTIEEHGDIAQTESEVSGITSDPSLYPISREMDDLTRRMQTLRNRIDAMNTSISIKLDTESETREKEGELKTSMVESDESEAIEKNIQGLNEIKELSQKLSNLLTLANNESKRIAETCVDESINLIDNDTIVEFPIPSTVPSCGEETEKAIKDDMKSNKCRNTDDEIKLDEISHISLLKDDHDTKVYHNNDPCKDHGSNKEIVIDEYSTKQSLIDDMSKNECRNTDDEIRLDNMSHISLLLGDHDTKVCHINDSSIHDDLNKVRILGGEALMPSDKDATVEMSHLSRRKKVEMDTKISDSSCIEVCKPTCEEEPQKLRSMINKKYQTLDDTMDRLILSSGRIMYVEDTYDTVDDVKKDMKFNDVIINCSSSSSDTMDLNEVPVISISKNQRRFLVFDPHCPKVDENLESLSTDPNNSHRITWSLLNELSLASSLQQKKFSFKQFHTAVARSKSAYPTDLCEYRADSNDNIEIKLV